MPSLCHHQPRWASRPPASERRLRPEPHHLLGAAARHETQLPTLRAESYLVVGTVAGMPLQQLSAGDNPLTSLDPLVETPPQDYFMFDCSTLPDLELERARAAWSARPECRQHARNAEVLLALRRHDLAALSRLASEFEGRRYLLVPKEMTWTEARDYCRHLGGHLATITSREENQFVARLLQGDRALGCFHRPAAAGGAGGLGDRPARFIHKLWKQVGRTERLRIPHHRPGMARVALSRGLGPVHPPVGQRPGRGRQAPLTASWAAPL